MSLLILLEGAGVLRKMITNFLFWASLHFLNAPLIMPHTTLKYAKLPKSEAKKEEYSLFFGRLLYFIKQNRDLAQP